MTMLEATLAKLESTERDLFEGKDHLAEITAEFRNEVALFGDGGPGSALRIDELRKHLEAQERRVAAIRRAVVKMERKS